MVYSCIHATTYIPIRPHIYSYIYTPTYTSAYACTYILYAPIVLSQKHPFEHVKSESVLCVTIHMNQRPNLDLDIPKDTPQEVIDMIRYV